MDTTKIQVGDTLTVRGKVRKVDPTDRAMSFELVGPEGAAFWIHNSGIVEHAPGPLSPGNRVWGLATKCSGEVLHVIGDLAWVRFDDGRHEVCFPRSGGARVVSITAGLEPYRKDPSQMVQILPSRRVSLGWVLYHLAALASLFGFLGFVLTVAFMRGAG